MTFFSGSCQRNSQANVHLSAKGLHNICQKDKGFTFIVGPRRYDCPLFVAEFLSPRIHDLRSVDNTFDEYEIEIEDPDGHFEGFLSLGSGSTIKITESNRLTILSVSGELWNSELYECICPSASSSLTMSSAVDRISFFARMRGNISNEVSFIASHFHELNDPSDSLRSLPFSAIYEILSDNSLKIKSEDLLYDFILSRAEDDCEYSGLLEQIRFEYLSAPKFNEFLNLISQSFEYMNHSVWSSLRSRLSFPVSPETSNDRVLMTGSGSRDFAPASSSSLNGIIAYLTRRCGGNVQDHDVIRITASSSYNSGLHEKHAADLEVNSSFQSQGTANQWICYDFKSMTVRPTHYSIRSYYDGNPWNYNPKNWVVEGSRDGTAWIELDRREHNNDLNDRNVTRTFPVSRSEDVRMIRLRQIGVNHYGSRHLLLSSFEIFGCVIG
jgi:hypothetical protein